MYFEGRAGSYSGFPITVNNRMRIKPIHTHNSQGPRTVQKKPYSDFITDKANPAHKRPFMERLKNSIQASENHLPIMQTLMRFLSTTAQCQIILQSTDRPLYEKRPFTSEPKNLWVLRDPWTFEKQTSFLW